MMATILVTLLVGVEPGVIAGVALSLALFLWRASRPHAAIVWRVPDTEHFRNVKRHKVFTDPRILTIRIDESLTYLNACRLEEFVLESIEAINHRLADTGVKTHLSEIKGPVVDALERSHFLHDLTGQVYLSQNEAFGAAIALADKDEAAQSPADLWLARGLI